MSNFLALLKDVYRIDDDRFDGMSEEKALAALFGVPRWWKRLSPSAQENYIKRHPRSVYKDKIGKGELYRTRRRIKQKVVREYKSYLKAGSKLRANMAAKLNPPKTVSKLFSHLKTPELKTIADEASSLMKGQSVLGPYTLGPNGEKIPFQGDVSKTKPHSPVGKPTPSSDSESIEKPARKEPSSSPEKPKKSIPSNKDNADENNVEHIPFRDTRGYRLGKFILKGVGLLAVTSAVLSSGAGMVLYTPDLLKDFYDHMRREYREAHVTSSDNAQDERSRYMEILTTFVSRFQDYLQSGDIPEDTWVSALRMKHENQ